ncbi:hypothetical protein ILYODFUR_036645 [Ilyodon furcidens]|uniref:Uncharacterized protein n=1 Tax=Ilyodon furcidens TaxID=33524 RepID=A0ABV0V955_9TELE
MARSQILRLSHAHILSCIKKLLITFHPQCLKSILSHFQVCKSKAVGGVRSDMQARNAQNRDKMATSIQNGRLPDGFGPMLQETFFVGPEKLHACTKFQIPWSKHGLGLIFKNFLGGAVDELGHAHQICHQISVGDWIRFNHIEFGADQMMYVEIKAKRMAMACTTTATPFYEKLLCFKRS